MLSGAFTSTSTVSLLVLLATAARVGAEPWNLPSYELCRQATLDGIPAESSGITYSQTTSSLWVITRRPQAVVEFNLYGEKLRQVSYTGLSDPEGITWMYGYTFAVAQEASGTATITIMDLVPWSKSAQLRKKLVLKDVHCEEDCLEGVTYDYMNNVFYAVVEFPMRVYKITPTGKVEEQMYGTKYDWPGFRDLAGIYYRPGDQWMFVLSQAEQNVGKFTFEGDLLENKRVEDNMVEGLTFTPDGHLMITCGEPNDLWIYTSTGSCDWEPEANHIIEGPTKAQVQKEQNIEIPGHIEDPDSGYCNWDGCTRTAQGGPWCNNGVDRCVGACGGSWCWWNGIGLTITQSNYIPPPPAPTMAPTPAPTEAPPREGFCNWGSCSLGKSGSEWCSNSVDICVNKCKGQYCWADGLDPPVTKADFPPPPPPPPPKMEYCAWTSGCSGTPPGSGDPWCSKASTNCVFGCGGTFCSADGSELTKSDFPSPPPVASPPLPKSPSPPAATATNSPPPPPTASGNPPSTDSPSSSPPNLSEPPPTPLSPAVLAPTPVPTLENITDRTTPAPGNKPPTQVVEIPGDDSFVDGYKASVLLKLQGIAPWQFDSLQQLYLRQAAAFAAYGSSNGFLQVVFNSTTSTSGDQAFFEGAMNVPNKENDVTAVGKLVDIMGRRHLRQTTPSASLNVTIELLGETKNHAMLLAERTQEAVESGELEEDMKARGFAYEVEIAVVNVTVTNAGVAPQYYPPGDQDEMVTYAPGYEEIDVILVEEEKSEQGQPLNFTIIGGAAGGAMLVAIVVVVVIASKLKKRSTKELTYQAPKTPKGQPTVMSDTFAGQDSPAIMSSVIKEGMPAEVQLGSVTDASGKKGHRRIPSEVLAGSSLLGMEDSYTPNGTPGHSRSNTLDLANANFASCVLDAATASPAAADVAGGLPPRRIPYTRNGSQSVVLGEGSSSPVARSPSKSKTADLKNTSFSTDAGLPPRPGQGHTRNGSQAALLEEGNNISYPDLPTDAGQPPRPGQGHTRSGSQAVLLESGSSSPAASSPSESSNTSYKNIRYIGKF